MFHMQERQLLLSSLLKKPVRNAVRRFSCFNSRLLASHLIFCSLVLDWPSTEIFNKLNDPV